MSQPGLVERDREISVLAGAVREALEGPDGRVASIEGPAGIAKTRLLAEVRGLAAAHGATVLTARGSELERDFPYGTVRQLLEARLADPATRERLLSGAAAPAAAVFGGVGAAGDDDGGDASFATLHGLYWLAVDLAQEAPLVLSIDDLQWCDRPSLRFIAYLVRRLEGLRVLVATTVRTTEPGTDPALLAEIAHDPATVAIRPGPLSGDAVLAVVRERLGDGAEPAFATAVHRASGGNPLLPRQLLTALEAEGIAPMAARADAVRDVGPRAVSRTVLLRLARLPADARDVAHAVAVLGDGADLTHIAALAGPRSCVPTRRWRSSTRSCAPRSTRTCRRGNASCATPAPRGCCTTRARRPTRSPRTCWRCRLAARRGSSASCVTPLAAPRAAARTRAP